MKKKIQLTIAFFGIFFLMAFFASAQCKIENKAFKEGEKLSYDLYYKYGIINAKAGVGTLSTTLTNVAGESAYRIKLLANTSGIAGNMYTVNDTLTGYVDTNMVPLLFTKEAFEGKDYSTDRQSYSYRNGEMKIRSIRHRNGKLRFDTIFTTNKCSYDYISVLAYARNLDYSNLKRGDNIPIQFVTGRKIVNMSIRYMGTESVKANDGKTYDSIKLSLMILDDAFADQQEAMNVALTNDLNRMPLIIEIGLKIGSMRVVLKKFSGIRHPIN